MAAAVAAFVFNPISAAAPDRPGPGFLSLLPRIRALEVETVRTVESIKMVMEHINESWIYNTGFFGGVRSHDK